MKDFESYLVDRHADQYKGLDDEMGENFDEWIADMDTDEMIDFADLYGEEIRKELTPTK